ncbi:MAG: helix-turn-helix transcriptional regulator [Clostridiales bacterium]|nr:helix-turn-helix transcriptional regulator [Clostridiales bacterium]
MNLSNFSKRLDELIKEHYKTITQFSLEISCSEATVSRYIQGKSYPTVDIAVRMADYFNCSVDFLLGIKDEEFEKFEFKPCPPFGERFVEVCKEKQISRYKLQQLTEIPESVMRYWVRGKTKPSIVNIVKIAEKLKVSVDYLLGREK